jgi:hypothetical protein
MVTSSQTTMAQAMPIMMLTQDFEPDEIPVLKLQQTYDNDSVVKVEFQSSMEELSRPIFMVSMNSLKQRKN